MTGRPSLTTRLTAFHALVSVCVLIGMGFLVLQATERHFIELDRDYLRDKIELIQKIARESPAEHSLSSRLDELMASHRGLFVRIQRGAKMVYGNPGWGEHPSFPDALTSADPVDRSVGSQNLRGFSAQLQLPGFFGGEDGAEIRLQIAIDTIHHRHFMHSLYFTLSLYLLSAIAVSSLLGWWAAFRGLAPLRVMRDMAKTVTAYRLDPRMPVNTVPTEFADLAKSLNAMLERLQSDFARLQEFSSDLAHELRTPINNLLTQTQVSLSKKREVATYQNILSSNAEEFQRLGRMVSDMLFLAKTEHGIELPHPESVSLRDVTQKLFDFYEVVADDKAIDLAVTGDAIVMGDRLMIQRAVGNLVSNAIRHSHPKTLVSVVIDATFEATHLVVNNTGDAIAREDLPRLFDRFFRSDKSRSHPDAEGSGLGLSITKAIMAAHSGSASVVSDSGRTSFRLSFPHRTVGGQTTRG